MAWNEPGGGKNNDPWGGGGGDQGPPDLDEAFKKLRDKLDAIFGGGSGGSGGGGSSPQASGSLIAIVLFSLVVLWAAAGFYQVDEKEQGVILRLGQYHKTVGSGLHWMPRLIDKKYIVRTTEERQYSSSGQMLTEDENIVELPLSVQYNIADVKAFVLNVKSPELSLEHATDSAIRHMVGSSTLDDVLSVGRQKLADDVEQRLQSYLDNYGAGINIIEVNIKEARPPSAVKAAYDDVVKAREDKERLVNEAQAYANGVIPEARGKAQRMVEEAVAYRDRVIAKAEGEAERFENLLSEYAKAPEVTRQRLYLDTVEEVMGNSSKVLVDVEGGNNMLYLPLDKIIEAQPAKRRSNDGGDTLSRSERESIADEVKRQLERDLINTRRRELR